MAGRACRAARLTSRSRCEFMNPPVPERRPATPCRTIAAKAGSRSVSELTSTMMSFCPIASAATWTSRLLALSIRAVGVREHADHAVARQELPQPLKTLHSQVTGQEHDARDVGTRPVQALDKPVSQRIPPTRRQRGFLLLLPLPELPRCDSRRLGPPATRSAPARWKAARMTAVRRAVLNTYVLAFHEPGFPQALLKCGYEVLRVGQRGASQETDHWERILSTARRKRPFGSRATEEPDQCPPGIQLCGFGVRQWRYPQRRGASLSLNIISDNGRRLLH